MRLVKQRLLIAVALTVLSAAVAKSRLDAQQAVKSMPSGVLEYMTYTARFVSDGRFEIAGTIEDMGSFRFDGDWSLTGDRLDLRGSLDADAARLFAMTGMPAEAMVCAGTASYRVGSEGANVTFDALSDTCAPRRLVLDRTRWRPAGTANRGPGAELRRDARIAPTANSSAVT